MRSLVTRLAFGLLWTGCAAKDGAPAATEASQDAASDVEPTLGDETEKTPASSAATDASRSEASATSAGTSPDVSSVEPVEPSSPAPDNDCQATGDGTTTLVFVNRCAKPLTVRGSDMEEGQLAPGSSLCRDIGTATEELPSKRYWAFAGEDPGNEHYTLAEFTFNTDFNDFDWYNISHVDAFNLPMQIVPLDEPDCQSLTCAVDLLEDCPVVGQDRDASGNVAVCVSPDRDDGESEVALYFERCDDAYAWSGDDQHGDDPSPVKACAGEDWQITFCPE